MFQKKFISSTAKHKKIVIAVPQKSAFRKPLVDSFKKLNYQVSAFDYQKTTLPEKFIFAASLIFKKLWNLGNSQINKRLVSYCAEEKPSILFVSKGKTITKNAITEIKGMGIVTINWFSDLFDSSEFFTKTLPAYDYVFTADDFDTKTNKKIMKIYHLPYAGVPDKKNPDFKKRPFDISFVGVWSKDRENLILALSEFNPKVWGDERWTSGKAAKFYQGSWLFPEQVLKIYQKTKIVVNQHEYKTKTKTTLNFRVYEATANGALVISDFRKDLPRLFKISGPKKEIVLYKNYQHLKQFVSFYLKKDDERIKIAKRGFKRTLKDHSFEKRIKFVMKIINA